eukprot:5129452-Pleurochrysis_carterae.AAC.1
MAFCCVLDCIDGSCCMRCLQNWGPYTRRLFGSGGRERVLRGGESGAAAGALLRPWVSRRVSCMVL